MRILEVLLALLIIVVLLIDCFETILQPRRVMHPYRYARLFYRSTWGVWRFIGTKIHAGRRREAFLGVFGPFSLLALFSTWVAGLIFGFALLHLGIRSPLHGPNYAPHLATYIYLSGTTFFTLGYGDITPAAMPGRVLAICESGLGFAFLAVIISYLPVLYQAFSRREAIISLLDARAGSPPSASEFLLRLARSGRISMVDPFLEQWELWAAELLESHLSFPVLSFYRSQHDNQSWVSTLATILDTCALLIATSNAKASYHPQLTFAMARHAAVDLSLVLKQAPHDAIQDRAPKEQRLRMFAALREAGLDLCEPDDIDEKLSELRKMYEPFLASLAHRFLFTLPPMMHAQSGADNWQRSAWMQRTPGIGNLPIANPNDEHFR